MRLPCLPAAALPAALLAALLAAPASATRSAETVLMSTGRKRLYGLGRILGRRNAPLVESDFAALSWCTYDLDKRSVPGWTLLVEDGSNPPPPPPEAGSEPKAGPEPKAIPTQVAVFQRAKGGQCALAFSGTKGLTDWFYNFDARGEDLGRFGLPGVVAHAGFMRRVRNLFLSPKWNTVFYPLLTQRCSEVFGIGHSLGAAVADLVAGVLNNVKNQTIQFRPEDPTAVVSGLSISRLYTFGAPGVTFGKRQLTNGLATDGTFGGARFFNFDAKHFDPITFTSAVGLLHPAMKAVMISNGTADGRLEMKAFDAASAEARTMPTVWAVGLSRWPSRLEHKVENYVSRMETLFGAAR